MDVLSGLVGALIGALLGVLGTFLTLRFNYRQLYAQTISSNRNLWRNELREYIAKMVAAAYPDKEDKKSNEYFVYRTQVLTRLNTKEPYHKMLEHLIFELDNLCNNWDETQFKYLQNNIVDVSCNIMKLEWETVKKEAKGGK